MIFRENGNQVVEPCGSFCTSIFPQNIAIGRDQMSINSQYPLISSVFKAVQCEKVQ